MTSMIEKRRVAREMAYLNEPSKILAALANIYGRDERMPSRAEIAEIVARRQNRKTVVHYADRGIG